MPYEYLYTYTCVHVNVYKRTPRLRHHPMSVHMCMRLYTPFLYTYMCTCNYIYIYVCTCNHEHMYVCAYVPVAATMMTIVSSLSLYIA